ncbi:MAG: hypothetical protein [Microvirus sp.]|nr:MAG: hypothetical protein [Microvirus sp.]
MKPTTAKSPERVVRLRSTLFYRLTRKDMETPRGVSLTVQDDAYTVRDLYDKFTRGIDMGLDRSVSWSEDPDHDDHDLEKLPGHDLVERQELLAEQKRKVQAHLDLLKQLDEKSSKKTPPKTGPEKMVEDAPEDDAEERPEDEVKPETKKRPSSEGKKSYTPS